MPVAVEFLFDPEIVVPSPVAKDDLGFWERLRAWTADDRPKLGQRCLEGLSDLMASPPSTRTISPRELHAIIGRLASRVLAPLPVGSVVGHDDCVQAWLHRYAPMLGDSENPERLASDLKQVAFGTPVVIASEPECWIGVNPSVCSACQTPRLYLYTTPRNGAASALRAEFLVQRPLTPDAVRNEASLLFPDLHFATSAWDRLGTLQGDPVDLARKLVEHLGVLDDYAVEIWAASGQSDARQQALRSFGVEASLESPATRASGRLMRLRDFAFGSRSLRCEWHTKLEPHRNRIHFTVAEGAVFIGTIEHHLATA